MEAMEEKKGCEEGEICGSAEGKRREMEAEAMQEKEDCGGKGAGDGQDPGDGGEVVVAEGGEGEVGDEVEGGESGKTVDGDAGNGMGDGAWGGGVRMLPGVDEETVEAAKEGEECGGGKER